MARAALLAAVALAGAAPLAAAVCQPPGQRVDVIFDLSGSMRAHADSLAERAAAILGDGLRPGDEVVVWFAGDTSPQGSDQSGDTRWLAALPLGAAGGSTNLLSTLEAVWTTPVSGPRLTLVHSDGADGDDRFLAAVGADGPVRPDAAAAVAALWLAAGAGDGPLLLDLLAVTAADGTIWDLAPLYQGILDDPRLQARPASEGLPPGWRDAVCLRPERLDFGDISTPGATVTVRPVSSGGEPVSGLVPTLEGALGGLTLEVEEQDGGETLILRLVGRPDPDTADPEPRELTVRWRAAGRPGLAILPAEQPATYLFDPPPVVCAVAFGPAPAVGWGGPGPLVAGEREFAASCDGLEPPVLRLLTPIPAGLSVEVVAAGGEVVARIASETTSAPLPPGATGLRLAWERPRRWRGEVAVEVVGPPEATYVVGGERRRGPPAAAWAVSLRPPAPWWVWALLPLGALAAAVVLRPRFSSSVSLLAGAGESLRPAREGRHRLPWVAQSCEVRVVAGRLASGRGGTILGVLVAGRGGRVTLELRAEATVGGLPRPAGRVLALRDGDEVRMGDIVITFKDRRAARRRGQRKRRG